ncbi:hypothetical protein [Azohydromonas lata]|uniref:hypothetical protein n=1 Tax=Azohydromonas lata TaxID=45677 RepID=UPI0012F4A7A8|nr:hypothetical protein [Azohydromonas lata]
MHQVTAYQDAAHRQQVIDLWASVFGHAGGHNEPNLSIDKKLAVNDGLFFVALIGDRVVGTTMTSPSDIRSRIASAWAVRCSILFQQAHRHRRKSGQAQLFATFNNPGHPNRT